MTIEAILSRFEHIRRNGNGWVARCPAHPDHKPSLSIHEREGISLHCHAGCSKDAVCKALGIEMRDLFTAGQSGNPTF